MASLVARATREVYRRELLPARDLSKTIPKHRGETCRIDLKPIGLRRGEDGPAITLTG